MGIFLNRGNEEFESIVNSEIYIDKTDMIDFFNNVINTEQRYICVSRPRRFGKSVTANMIAAYYCVGCDSATLFEGKKLSYMQEWKRNMNQYPVIHIDMADIRSRKNTPEETLQFIEENLVEELNLAFPGIVRNGEDVVTCLTRINEQTKARFVIIIDEWDCLFREDKNNLKVQETYINLLRGLFKGNSAKKFTALAYITGILPIKKYNSESALNNFYEYTMTNPKKLAKYIGFTEDEVRGLCEKYHMDFDQTMEWYDGYSFRREQHICGPNSIVQAMLDGEFNNYWSQTVAYHSLSTYITMNYDGLKDSIVSMLSGHREKVKIRTYENDMTSFKRKDDVLTALIHLGYLAYDMETEEVYIPNKEVRMCFEDTMEDTGWSEVIEAMEDSEKLLQMTLAGMEDEVAEKIDICHSRNTSILKYNDENSLASCISLAYYTARKDYMLIRELPTGYGFADIVFLPKRGVEKPAMVVELKWRKDAETAIAQIKTRHYADALKGYSGDVVLVGVNYNKNVQEGKKHSCRIERMTL